MIRKHILICASIVMATLFLAAGICVAAAPDVIKMDNKAYESHKKGIVEFHHLKHAETYATEYPDLYKDGCGVCHHDDQGKPLTDLTSESEVQSCIACHKIPGEVPKDLKKKWKTDKVKKAEKDKMARDYHAEAVHDNCRGCHKAFNKKYKPKKAPTSCTKCHPKTKK